MSRGWLALRGLPLRLPTLVLALSCALVACGGSTPKPQPPAHGIRVVDPTEVIPADLDLVVRVDLPRLRAAIGHGLADELSRKLLRDGVEQELHDAVACGEVLWIATRAASLETPDHVIVVEGRDCLPDLPRSRWTRIHTSARGIAAYDRIGEVSREGNARILDLAHRAVAFVSPVELHSVQRVLDQGPDPRRGDPKAEGVVSVDFRVRPLPAGLERKYPSIAAVIAGLDRVRGTVTSSSEGVRFEIRILAKSSEGANRAARFLESLRDNLSGERFSVAKTATIETVGTTVQLDLVMLTNTFLGLLVGSSSQGK